MKNCNSLVSRIPKNIKQKSNDPITMEVEKKKLGFKRVINHVILSQNVNKIIRSAFLAAGLQQQFKTYPVLRQNLNEKLPHSTTSMCLYKLKCSYGLSYIGHAIRQLSKPITEHNLALLRKELTKSIQSSAVQHLVDTKSIPTTPSPYVIESHLGQPKILEHDYYRSQRRSVLKYLGQNYASKRHLFKLLCYLD